MPLPLLKTPFQPLARLRSDHGAQKKPRSSGMSGVWRLASCSCRRVSQGRDKSSRSAVEASDCFQFYQGWLPGGVRNEPNNCRLNLWCPSRKSNVSITPVSVIGALFLAIKVRGRNGKPAWVQGTRSHLFCAKSATTPKACQRLPHVR